MRCNLAHSVDGGYDTNQRTLLMISHESENIIIYTHSI